MADFGQRCLRIAGRRAGIATACAAASRDARWRDPANPWRRARNRAATRPAARLRARALFGRERERRRRRRASGAPGRDPGRRPAAPATNCGTAAPSRGAARRASRRIAFTAALLPTAAARRRPAASCARERDAIASRAQTASSSGSSSTSAGTCQYAMALSGWSGNGQNGRDSGLLVARAIRVVGLEVQRVVVDQREEQPVEIEADAAEHARVVTRPAGCNCSRTKSR